MPRALQSDQMGQHSFPDNHPPFQHESLLFNNPSPLRTRTLLGTLAEVDEQQTLRKQNQGRSLLLSAIVVKVNKVSSGHDEAFAVGETQYPASSCKRSGSCSKGVSSPYRSSESDLTLDRRKYASLNPADQSPEETLQPVVKVRPSKASNPLCRRGNFPLGQYCPPELLALKRRPLARSFKLSAAAQSRETGKSRRTNTLTTPKRFSNFGRCA